MSDDRWQEHYLDQLAGLSNIDLLGECVSRQKPHLFCTIDGEWKAEQSLRVLRDRLDEWIEGAEDTEQKISGPQSYMVSWIQAAYVLHRPWWRRLLGRPAIVLEGKQPVAIYVKGRLGSVSINVADLHNVADLEVKLRSFAGHWQGDDKHVSATCVLWRRNAPSQGGVGGDD
jgi:hypothetical protein